MRIIASLLGLVPVMAVLAPAGEEGATLFDFSGEYADCSTQSLLPDVPPVSIEIQTSFEGGVNDVIVTPGAGSVLPQVTNTFIADGKERNMLIQEFGLPVGATRMVEFQQGIDFDRLVVDQTDDLFGTIVLREISLELFNSGRLDYNVSFGPFIVYSVRCQLQE